MRKKIIGAALSVVASALITVGAPSPASAAPTGCSIQAHPVMPNDGRVSYCSSGTGGHRIVLRCNEGSIYGNPDYYVYGDWVGVDEYSGNTCFMGKTSGFYRGASIEVRD